MKKLNMIGVLVLLAALALSALVVERATLEEISSESHLVFYGKVLAKESKWENKVINTYITLEVYETAKGNIENRTITVKQMGGKVGAYADEVAGSPTLYEDDEVFLFLVNWKDNYWIHSIALGAYSVVEVAGVKYAVNGFNNIQFSDPLFKKQGEELKGEYELDELLSKVKSISEAK